MRTLILALMACLTYFSRTQRFAPPMAGCHAYLRRFL